MSSLYWYNLYTVIVRTIRNVFMSLISCIIFLAFYPAIFITAYVTKSKITFSIGICSLLMGSIFTYGIYNDVEFWTGWIKNWSRSAQIGFGHSAFIFTLIYIMFFITKVISPESYTSERRWVLIWPERSALAGRASPLRGSDGLQVQCPVLYFGMYIPRPAKLLFTVEREHKSSPACGAQTVPVAYEPECC